MSSLRIVKVQNIRLPHFYNGIKYGILMFVFVVLSSCSVLSKGNKGELKTKSKPLTRKQMAGMPADASAENAFKRKEELRMIEYRIMYYKQRIKEAKKAKLPDRVAIFEINLKRYQRRRRQLAPLIERAMRDLQSEF